MLAQGKNLPHSSKLLQGRPVLDEDELVRCNGRLRYAECLSYDTHFQIILPRGHWITTLIVKHYHEKGYHASGTNQTLADLSSRFWIIAAREEIRAWEKNCTECRRRKAKPAGAFATDKSERISSSVFQSCCRFCWPFFHRTRKRES